MNNSTEISLKQLFKNVLNEPTCVCVENFQKEMRTTNNMTKWTEKETSLKDFQLLVYQWKPDEFELYSEGLRCLTQIFINLLKDFHIFKIYPIRKYSSAFNYISKIDKYEDILVEMGYQENCEEKNYKLKPELTDLEDKEKAIDIAYNLLICFMELSELIKLRYEMCDGKDLISLRETNVNKQIENYKFSKLSDEEIKKLFEKCELCENEVDLNDKKCIICEAPIKEFSIAYKFKDFLSKYDIIVPEPEVHHEIPTTPADNRTETVIKPKIQESENGKPTESSDWCCGKCTFKNESKNLNCIICEASR